MESNESLPLTSMNELSPCLACTLNCPLYDGPMCIRNFVSLAVEKAPITLGLHVGLNHLYRDKGLPPCVRGSLGTAHWSILPNSDNPTN